LLTFGDRFNQPADNLPITLTSITFGASFNQKLSLQNFQFLRILVLSGSYGGFVDLEDCPLTLEKITYGGQNIDLNLMRKQFCQ
jgi:hypothetical protein